MSTSTKSLVPYTPPARDPQTVELGDALAQLRRRKWLLMAVAGVIAVPLVTAVQFYQPRYTASAHVMIEPNERMRVDVGSAVAGLPADVEAVRSEIETLQSADLARRVIARLGLELARDLAPGSSGFSSIPYGLAAALGQPLTMQAEPGPLTADFLKRLSVEQVERSRVITVSYRSGDPQTAARVANLVVDTYVDHLVELKQAGSAQTASWMEKRLTELRDTVRSSEMKVADYRRDSGLVTRGGLELVEQRLAELNGRLAVARAKAAEAASRLEQMQTVAADRVGDLFPSPLIMRLREQEAVLAVRLAEEQRSQGERSPQLLTTRQGVSQVRAMIAMEAQRILRGTQSELGASRALEAALQAAVDHLTQEMTRLNEAAVHLRSLESEAEANRTVYADVLRGYKGLSAQQSFLHPDARVVGYADAVALGRSLWNRHTLSGLVLVFATVLAVLVLRLVVYFDRGFARITELEQATGLPVLAALPHLSRGRGRRRSAGRAAFDETVRMLLARLLVNARGTDGLVLLVTSGIPGEGKSVTALALARQAALSGCKCLLVDGDSRHASVSKAMRCSTGPGLLELLRGEASLAEAVQRDTEAPLDVVAAGGRLNEGLGLLASSQADALFASMRHGYDLTIIDSPPVLAVYETQLLARLCDQSLMLVQWSKTQREVVRDALRVLEGQGVPPAGLVLTQVNYRKYTKYAGEEMGSYYRKLTRYYAS